MLKKIEEVIPSKPVFKTEKAEQKLLVKLKVDREMQTDHMEHANEQ